MNHNHVDRITMIGARRLLKANSFAQIYQQYFNQITNRR